MYPALFCAPWALLGQPCCWNQSLLRLLAASRGLATWNSGPWRWHRSPPPICPNLSSAPALPVAQERCMDGSGPAARWTGLSCAIQVRWPVEFLDPSSCLPATQSKLCLQMLLCTKLAVLCTHKSWRIADSMYGRRTAAKKYGPLSQMLCARPQATSQSK